MVLPIIIPKIIYRMPIQQPEASLVYYCVGQLIMSKIVTRPEKTRLIYIKYTYS